MCFSKKCAAAAAVSVALLAVPCRGQNRPLKTAEVELVPPGTLRAQVGFDFLQDVDFPLSGLSGDLTSIAVINVRVGVGKLVEIQMQGAAQQFLDIKRQGASFVPLSLTGQRSTRDSGDFTLATKIRLWDEKGRRPAVGFRFGFEMPNSNQARGIGTNTTNVFAGVILQKHFFSRLNVFGNVGILILQAPNALHAQNDVLAYGIAFGYPVHRRVNLVGEVTGRHSTRTINVDLIGTESRSEARVGVQIFAGGFQWDVAGIAGLTSRDAKSGFTFGISRDVRIFDYGKVP